MAVRLAKAEIGKSAPKIWEMTLALKGGPNFSRRWGGGSLLI